MSSVQRHSLTDSASFLQNWREDIKLSPQSKDICFKVFIVFTSLISVAIIIAATLSLLASQGYIHSGVDAIHNLQMIGEVNSYMMVVGGCALFILSILAWGCHVKNGSNSSE